MIMSKDKNSKDGSELNSFGAHDTKRMLWQIVLEEEFEL